MKVRDVSKFVSRRHGIVIAALVAACVVSISVVAARTWTRPPGRAASGARAGAPPEAAAGSRKTLPGAQGAAAGRRRRSVEAELVTLGPNGFEPARITRPAGEFLLMVENRSGLRADLRLARETGERLHEMKVSREEPDWSELEDLRPGRYLLTEAGHPGWVCRVNVTAR